MICREVMEDMQRELDGDLSEAEAEALSEHIRQCGECAAMYERLKRVSAELENLPKVTPPINLVDAILPQLERIDRQLIAESNEPAASSDAAAAEAEAPLAGRTRRAASRRRWTERFSIRTLSGVVAAGIVVGIFLVTYDADPGGVNDSAPQYAMDAADGSMKRAVNMDASGSAEIMMSDQFGDEIRLEAQDHSGSAADDTAARSMSSFDEPAAGAGASSGASDAPRSSQTPASPPRTDNSGTNAEETPAGDDGETAQSDQPIPDAGVTSIPGIGADDDAAGNELELDEPVGFLGMPEIAGGHNKGLTNEGDALWGVTSVPGVPAESSSPDGAYIAVLEESRVAIYDAGRVKLYESEPFAGVVTSIEWTPESHELHVEVTLEDGTVEQYRIDAALGTLTRE